MSGKESEGTYKGSGLLSMREVERRHIREVLGATKGNRTEAARILGVDRKTLYRKLLSYGIDSIDERG